MDTTKPIINVMYLYSIFFTNKDTGKLDWEQITCGLTVDQVLEVFEKMWSSRPVDYSQPIAIIPGWLTQEQVKALSEGPKKTTTADIDE